VTGPCRVNKSPGRGLIFVGSKSQTTVAKFHIRGRELPITNFAANWHSRVFPQRLERGSGRICREIPMVEFWPVNRILRAERA
jgi:hypothetical protein